MIPTVNPLQWRDIHAATVPDLVGQLNARLRGLATMNALLVPLVVQPPPVTQPRAIPTQQWEQVWNTTVTQTGLLLNVTDTSSPAASLLIDLRVGGVSMFSVRKDGLATLPGGLGFATLTITPGPLIVGTDPGGVDTVRVGGNVRAEGGFASQVGGVTVGTFGGGDANGAVELGKIGVATTPFIDFHANATATDFDVRVLASGGAGAGTGTASLFVTAAGFVIGPDPGGARRLRVGGGATFKEPSTYTYVTIDAAAAQQSALEFANAGTSKWIQYIDGAGGILRFFDGADRLWFKPGGEVDILTGPLVIGVDPGGTGFVRVGGGVRVANAQPVVWNDAAGGATNQGWVVVNSSNNLTFAARNALRMRLTDVAFSPDAASGITLGTAALSWGNAYITQVLFYNGGAAGGGYLQIDGTPKLIISLDNTTRAQLTSTDFTPTAAAGLDLGTGALPWNNVWARSLLVKTAAGNIVFTVADSGGATGMEFGRQDAASTSFIDLHSGATAADYDVRLAATGGTGVSGGGALTVTGAILQFVTPGLRVEDASNALFDFYNSGVRRAGFSVIAADVLRFTDSGGTVKLQFNFGGTTGRLIPPSTSWGVRNNADSVYNLLVSNGGQVDLPTGPLIVGTDPGAAGAASTVRIGGGLLLLNDPVPSAVPAVTDDPGFRVGYTPAVFGDRVAIAKTVIIGHLQATPEAGLAIVVTTSGATAQYGMVSSPNFNATATVSGYCYNGRVEVDLFPHTMAVGAVYQAADGVVGTGAITTLYGLLIENLTVGGTNISIKTGTAPVIFGTDPGGSDLLRVGGAVRLNGTLTQIGGPIVFTNGAATSIGTSDNFGFSIKTNALVRWSVSTAGNLEGDTTNGGAIKMGPAVSKIIAGATSLSLRNNADTGDNILITDAGVITFRNQLQFTTGNNTSLGTTDAFGLSIKTNALVRTSWDTSGNQLADITNGGYIEYRAGTSSVRARASGVLFKSGGATTTSTTTATLTGGSGGGTYTLKANTLAADGDTLRIVYIGDISATTGTFTLTVGGITILNAIALSSGGTFAEQVWITRVDATNIRWSYMGLHFNAVTVTDQFRSAGSVALTLTSDQTINFQGSAAAGTLTAYTILIHHEAGA